MNGLRDRVVLVTGGAQGIGAEYGRRLANEGAKVVVADVNVAKGEAVARELSEAAAFAEVDVSDEGSCEAMAAAAVERFGRIDGLVNNAATSPPA